jgi:uncharacterized protein YkwD
MHNDTGKRRPDELLNMLGGIYQDNIGDYDSEGNKTKIKYFNIRKIKSTQTPAVIEPPVIEQPPKLESLVTYETEVHKLVNAERKKAGLAELQYDVALAEIAVKHSIDMSPAGRHFYDNENRVNQKYLNYPYPYHHTNPDGWGVVDRYRQAEYSGYAAYGENILYYSNSNLAKMSKQEIAQKIMYWTKGWWYSLPHKANILSTKYNREGLGIYAYGDTLWATQNFSKK